METKKSSKANLENKKLLFKEIGLILACLLILAAFEWKSSRNPVTILQAENIPVLEEDQIPVTLETPPQLPPANIEPVLSDLIEIVNNEVKVDSHPLLSPEDDPRIGIEYKPYIPKTKEEEVVPEDAIPYAAVEEKPSFRGGDHNSFTKWVFSQIDYPEIAKENGVQGRVTLQFTVNIDGSVSDVTILRGVDSSLDKEAVRVVSASPKWSPGKQQGRAVKVRYVFPVIFQLR